MRRILPCLLFALLSGVTVVVAFDGPAHGQLANYDRRLEAGQGGAAMDADQAAAAAALRGRLPGVKVDLDWVTGAPRSIRIPGGYLTGAGGGGGGVSPAGGAQDPNRVTKAFVREHAALLGHGVEALAEARVSREFDTSHNGMRTMVWQQRRGGLEVFGAVMISHLTAREELVSLSSCFMPDAGMGGGGGGVAPELSARGAVAKAAGSVGVKLEVDGVKVVRPAGDGVESGGAYGGSGLEGDAEVRLIWLPINRGEVRLCWEVVLCRREGGETYRVLVDAKDGMLWVRHCLTEYIAAASYRVFTSDSPSPMSPGLQSPGSGQPALVGRELVVTSALDTNASPLGWISDGVNETSGNNVAAHLDRNADNLPDLPRPTGTASRVFDFPFDAGAAPSTYGKAAVVQLFYWNNWIHDRLYQLGFTEAAGNFQMNNFGRGGLGGDAVQADAQDGSGVNNANFTTLSDGLAPRMQMFTWNGPDPDRDGDFDAEIVIHEYAHGLSNRRVGGGAGLVQLQSRGMGEGWSDLYALALLSQPGDDVDAAYAMGGYSTRDLRGLTANYYYGIRRYPYSTDLQKNPLTFKDIDPGQASSHAAVPRNPVVGNTADQVHNIGTVWCAALWDARANLIRKHGFSPGNEMFLRLVTDGMNLSPPNPDFLEGRDGILSADLVNHGGANESELWAAFAKRGMGLSATSPGSYTTAGVVEAYDIPDDLAVSPATGGQFVGSPGGPFVPRSETRLLTNGGEQPVAWSAGLTVNWLVLSNRSGVLGAGESVSLEVAVTVAAGSLGVGDHVGRLCITNETSGSVRCLDLILHAGPDPFVELFEDEDLDLSEQSFTFTPDGSAAYYQVCRSVVAEFPTDPAAGTVLSLSDDSFVPVQLGGGSKVSLYGVATDVIYVGSNGYITFGGGDTQFLETVTAHFGKRRVAGLFRDLNPSAGGSVSWKQLSDRVAVTYLNVPEFGVSSANQFQIELFFDGRIRITYLAMAATGGIAGLSAGAGIPAGFGERDFSSYPECGGPVPQTLVVSTLPGTTRNNFSGWVGMRFTVGAESMTVAGLGRYVVQGNSGVHRLKLVRADTLADVPGALTSVSLAGRTVGKFVYGLLALSVRLDSGVSYYLVSEEVNGGDAWHDLNTSVNLTPAAVCDGPVFGGNGGWFPFTGPGVTYVPMDLLYTTVPPGPEVALTSPGDGAFFVEPADIALVARATVPGGSVVRVEFYEGGDRLGERTAPPYALDWNGVVPGEYELTAVLTDNLGLSVTSSVVRVTVRADLPGSAFVQTVVPGALRNNFGGWVGMQFTVGDEPLRVLELGRMYVSGNTGSTVVKLVRAGTGSDVPGGAATVVLDGGVPNAFVYGLLPVPVTLEPGMSYGLVSQERVNGNRWYDLNTELTTRSTATCDGAVWIGGGGYNLFLDDDHSYVPVDFKYEDDSVAPPPPGVPTVELTGPVDGARFVAPANVRLEAVAEGNGGVVTSVQFYEGGGEIGEATSMPYAFDWSGVGLGTYELSARMTDSRGMSATSAVVTVTVTDVAVGRGYVVSHVAGAMRNNFNGWVGMKIRVGTEALTVTELGRAVVPGNTRIHTVKLVDAVTGLDVPGGAAAVDTSGVVQNGHAFGVLQGPVTLAPQGQYYIVSQETLGGDRWYDSDTDVVTESVAVCEGPVWSNGGGWNAVPNVDHSYVPPNFKYQASPAPLRVAIVSPAVGSAFPDPANILIEVEAGGGEGIITNVEFRADAIVLGSVTGAPYRWTWADVGVGNYSLTAVATDDRGVSVVSGAVEVSVTANVPGTGFVVSTVAGNPRNDFGGWVGMRFTVGANLVRVTEVGRFVWGGNQSTHVVKLVHALTGLDVAGGAATVPTAGVGQGQVSYGLLSQPLTLPAGASYYLVSQETVDGDRWLDLSTEVTTAGVGICDGPVWGVGGSWNFIVLPRHSYVPVDFKYATESGPPSVTITSPVDGARFVAPADVVIEVNAVGNGSSVTKVEFYEGANLLGEDTTSPYGQGWSGVGVGEYALTARVWDGEGRVATSGVVTVTVSTNVVGAAFVVGSVPGTSRNDFPGWVGMQITVGGTPLNAVALGRMAAAAGGGNHRVRLVDVLTGGRLGEVTVNLGTVGPGQKAYAPLAAPVLLGARRSYYLVSEEFVGGDPWYDLNTSITPSAVAICNGPVWGGPGAWNPVLNPNKTYVPVDFQYVAAGGAEGNFDVRFSILDWVGREGGLVLRIEGEANAVCVVEASEDMELWMAVSALTLSDKGTGEIAVKVEGVRRFFRIRRM